MRREYLSAILTLLCIFTAIEAQAQAHCRAAIPSTPAASLPAPPLMSGIGNSSLRISTTSEEAQAYFNQGLNLLHDFWDFEALRAFLYASKLDPEAGMNYWGIVMALPQSENPETEELRKFALARARELRESASEKEKLFIDSVLARYEGESATALKNYLGMLKRIVLKFPDEPEAKLFVARSQMSGYSSGGQPHTAQLESEKLVRQVLKVYPRNSAAHHYWIHLMELSPTPARALESAQLLPKLAPNSGHIVHMPGHIYYLLGQYQAAYDSFIASHTIDLAYMQSQKVAVIDTWNYIHNLDYLIATAAELGRQKDALRWAEELFGISLAKSRRAAPGAMKLAYDGFTSEVRLYFRFREWEKAVKRLETLSQLSTVFSKGAKAYFRSLHLYAAARVALENSQIAKAKLLLEQLEAHFWASANTTRVKYEEGFFTTSRSTTAVLLDLLRGLVSAAEGKLPAAKDWLQQAKQKQQKLGYQEPPTISTPIDEELGWLLVEAGKYKQAFESFEQALQARPESGFLFYALAHTSNMLNDRKAAARYQAKLQKAWEQADRQLPQLKQFVSERPN